MKKTSHFGKTKKAQEKKNKGERMERDSLTWNEVQGITNKEEKETKRDKRGRGEQPPPRRSDD